MHVCVVVVVFGVAIVVIDVIVVVGVRGNFVHGVSFLCVVVAMLLPLVNHGVRLRMDTCCGRVFVRNQI